ncbi:MAP3K12-binding inhibitory protein 1 [Patella vulgata]|uniref:MAP3K12-binding inhibitory protein 1 n=1 Tax=Patella vulgata TaxID=6465 RepID=UPI0021800BF2|nr:MAP3K12-binding inhibitory protein 1 [Patella vulgata]
MEKFENIFLGIIPDICDYLCEVKTLQKSELDFIVTAPARPIENEKFKEHLDVLYSKIKTCFLGESGSREFKDETSPENFSMSEKTYEEQDEKISYSVDDKSHENTVQIRASKSEIDRRIESYMNQKQVEVNEFNKREFSFGSGLTTDNWSCARTDSVFIPRAGSRSHIKITKVVNSFGPQTQLLSTNQDEICTEPSKKQGQDVSGMEERLKNIETHSHVNNESKDLCARLKALENRILFLEGLSPEYFNQIPARKYVKRSHEPKINQISSEPSISLTDIDSQIKILRESLLNK